MISCRDKESDLQSYLEKRTKTNQQTQLSSTNTNISTFSQLQSENTIPDSISGSTMNPDQLIEHVSQCSSSIKSTNAQPTPPQSSTVMYRTHMISDPHEIRLYRNYQRARYQRTEFPTYFKEPNPSIKKFINLELVNKKRESREKTVEGMTDKLHGNVRRYVQQREPLGIEQIAEVKEGEKFPRNILIEGDPGVGKTTLIWELCKGWGENRLLQQWDVVVLVQLRDKYMREADSLQELLDPHEQFGSDLYQHLKTTNGRGVMIIYDGYDELSKKQKKYKSVFQRLLTGGILPEATVIVTSRPLATKILPEEFQTNLHEHIEVVGFSDNDIDEYVKCKFCDTPDMLIDFQSYISSHPFIYKAMYIPLHCALVTDLYQTYWRKGKKEFAPKTITQLYTCFIHSLLERYLDDHPVYGPRELCVQELTDLPQDVFDDLMRLAELAAQGIREQEYVFDNLTHNTLGLMQRVNDSESRKSKSVSYSFLHLTLQEYLAALYWSKLSSEKVSSLFTETGALPVKEYISGNFWAEDEYRQKYSNIHWPVLHFYGGLTGVVGTPLENVFVGMKSSVNHNVLYLLFESQNPEYISTVLKENKYVKSKLQGYITRYCISHSSSTAMWSIDDKNNHLLQSMISSTSSSSMGGMIINLGIGVTDYSKCFQMLFQLEKHTKALSYLCLHRSYFSYSHSDFTHSKSHADNYICCDELSQLYRYWPKLKKFQLLHFDNKLNCTSLFSSLHLMTCLETLDLSGIVIDDSSHIVSNALRQTTTLKSLILSNCDLMSLSPQGLSQNKSIVSLMLKNIMMNVEGFKALKLFLIESINLTSLTLEGNLHHFNCHPNEDHSISFIMRKELFEGIQQSKSLKTLGLNNCELLGLEMISTNSSLTSLILQNLEMDKEGAMTLKQLLIENTTLREIELDDCIKSMEVAEVVAEGLQYNTGVTKLVLCYTKGVRTLVQRLQNNTTLTSLVFIINPVMDKEGAMTLKQVLIENTTLREIQLRACIRSMEVAKVVAEGLQYNTGITKLVLCDIKGVGTLVQRLRNNITLTSLVLYDLQMDKEEAMSLKQVLIENTTLREIELYECIKSMEVAEVVAEGLQYNTGITKLVLLSIEGVGTLVQRLQNNTTLTSLMLSNLEMDKEGAMALKHVLFENTTLREIRLYECIKSKEVAEVVAEGLQCNTGITKLAVWGTEGVGTLVQRLRNSTTLTSLELYCLEMDKEEAMSLKQVLIENTTLREIELYECIKSMEVAEVVAEGLQYNTGITKSVLLSIEGVGTLVQRLQNNTTLTSLMLSNLEMDKEGAMALKHVLFENTTLRV